jgi:hypothetical protein
MIILDSLFRGLAEEVMDAWFSVKMVSFFTMSPALTPISNAIQMPKSSAP